MLKAYQVDFDNGGAIVFAERSVVARRIGANKLDIDFESVTSCRRRPEYDSYAAQGYVPVQMLIEHGWWYECSGCSMRITSDLEDDDGGPIDPVYEPHQVWCSQTCRASEHRRRARERRTAAAIPRYVRRRWPLAECVRVHAAEFGTGDRSAIAYFKFPGSLGAVDYTIRATRSELANANGRAPGKAMVQRRDVKAWYDFIGKPELFKPEDAA